MVLVLNTITTEEGRQRFDSLFRDKTNLDKKIDIHYLTDEIEDLEKYSHLVISGSSLSAVDGSDWEIKIFKVLDHFVKEEKAVLGICYGHHILARYLGGKSLVRRATKAQYGFRKINLKDNRIFSGISELYGMEAHQDEVCNLSEDFNVIAEDEEGCIQAFQYKDKRIWGMQFHPEYDYFNGLASWERRFRDNPEMKSNFVDNVPNYLIMEQNWKIFQNFIKS